MEFLPLRFRACAVTDGVWPPHVGVTDTQTTARSSGAIAIGAILGEPLLPTVPAFPRDR
jgi:hypothetical protein